MVAAFTDVRPVSHTPKPAIPNRTLTPASLRRAARPVRALVRRGRTEADWLLSRGERADLAFFHEFHRPPYGGGNQFLLALVGELRRRGLALEVNRLSGRTPDTFLHDTVAQAA